MSEIHADMSVEQLIEQLQTQVHRIADVFVPSNGAEQKEAFLAGQVRNPHHEYARLGAIAFDEVQSQVADIGDKILSHPHVSPLHASVYEDYIAGISSINSLQKHAHALWVAPQDSHSRVVYNQLNDELFGGISRADYAATAVRIRQTLEPKGASPGLLPYLQEQLALLPDPDTTALPTVDELLPDPALQTKIEHLVGVLFGGLVSHVPETSNHFEPHDIAKVFTHILDREFGAAAEGWGVAVAPAQNINVNAVRKIITVPEQRASVTRDELSALVVHEIGVHAMRAINGAQSDFSLLSHGFPASGEAEEGLAMVMQQASEKRYRPVGAEYYLAAGLMKFEGYDFRDVHHALWRIPLLASCTDTPSPEQIQKARSHTYNFILRITRGTDSAPLLKDLAYPNGVKKMWRHMSAAVDDPELISTMFAGKIDPTNPLHTKVLYNSRTK